MKLFILITFLGISVSVIAQSKTGNDSIPLNPNYDALLAKKLGGDDYGMKKYYFVLLKTGTNTTTDKTVINESFRGHMNNINRLVEEGKIVVAGPFGKNEHSFRGLFILNNVKTEEEAKEILETDLAIKNKILAYDIIPWYGSAALPEYLPYSDKIWKVSP